MKLSICLFAFGPAAVFVEENVPLKYFFAPRLSHLCLSAFYLAFLQPCDFLLYVTSPQVSTSSVWRMGAGGIHHVTKRHLPSIKAVFCPSDIEMSQ